jgi:putative oxidoreductase
MRHLATVVGILLGLLFIVAGGTFLVGLIPDMPAPAEGSLLAQFQNVFWSTHWLFVVKVCELIGGVLVAIPRTRNIGLLILGPIIINIGLASALVMGEPGNPLVIGMCAAALFLLWHERRAFAGLITRPG